ncbi:ribonuclease H-like domain-containing protein [Tanacetum coccineum]
MGFIIGSCLRSDYVASAPLLEQWDRCHAVVLNWIMSSLSQDVYLGHVFSDNLAKFDILTKLPYCTCAVRAELVDHGKLLRLMQFLMGLDDIYQPVRSSIVTREILPEAKYAFVIISREESHRGMPSGSVKTEASAFVSRSYDHNRRRPNNTNGNWSNNNGNNGNKGNYDSLLCKNYGLKGHTIERCFEIIGYPSGFKRNPNLKPSGSFNNNKTNFSDTKGNNDVKTSTGTVSLTNDQVMKLMSLLNDKGGSTTNAHMAANVSELNLTVGHPNGTFAKITHVGNLRLNNNVVLFDVLVIPEYTVSLFSVNKLIKDSKVNVCFDETKCYIQDLKKEKVLGTGRESASLLPSSVLNDKSSFSLMYGREPNLSHLRSFECLCFATVVKGSDKFSHSPNDEEEGSSGRDGRVQQPVSDANTDQPGYGETYPATPLDENNVSEGNAGTSEKVPVFEIDLPIHTEEVKYGLNRYANYSVLSSENYGFVSNLNKSVEPTSYEEDLKDINWINAMNEEMNALYENKTWVMTELPFDRNPIGCKWIFKIKYKSNGEVERYKARLIAKGFGQKEGIDYEETFSPMVKMSIVRGLINLAIQKDWKIYQMDVNNAFLYGDLKEEVYMLPPPGFFKKSERLIKSLYGLKQAPRQLNQKLLEALLEAGFEQSKNDHSVFIKNKGDVNLYLLVYVDDLVITGNNNGEIDNFKSFLNKKFKIKDLRKLKYFLGIEVLKTKRGLCLNQRKYCLELLHEYGLLACRPIMTPLPKNLVLNYKETETDKYLINVTNYQKLIDIGLRVLKYLKLAHGLGVEVVKREGGCVVSAYFESNWAKCPMTRRFISGYRVFVNGNLVSWKSFSNVVPAELFCDNKSAMQKAANPVMHEKTKHFDIDVHLVREKVASGLIKTVKVDTKAQTAMYLDCEAPLSSLVS